MNINVNSMETDAALALLPMFLPGAKQTVQPPGYAHLGVPQSIYPTPTGLPIVIDPFTMKAGTLAAFDTVTVWLNGQATSAIKIVQPGEENQRVILYLPTGLLRNGLNQLFYRVDRLSGNHEDSTPILDVLYHDPAPGFPAPAGITIVHPTYVGPSDAATGVTFSFNVSFARPYDQITLSVGGWSTTITVTDPSSPITVTLSKADFEQIGDNANTPVRCVVVDQLGNSNQSATTYMSIQATVPDLAIDTSEMNLDGIMIVNSYGWPTNEMERNTATRIARGGVPPYSYISANTLVAQVSSSGKVTGLKNGITTITVADAANQRVSYSVRVSNVYQLLVNNALLTAEEGKTWMQSVGGVNSYNIIQYVSPSLVNPVRDLYENRIYPDPLGSRIYQYVATQVNFLCWNGSYIGGLGLLYGDSKRIRALTCIPT